MQEQMKTSDKTIVEIVEALKQSQPAPVPGSGINRIIVAAVAVIATAFVGAFMSMLVGLFVYFVTRNVEKSDDNEQITTKVILQIANLQEQFGKFSVDLASVKENQANSRIDPFTGTMGLALKDNIENTLESEISTLKKDLNEDISLNREKVRELELQLRELTYSN